MLKAKHQSHPHNPFLHDEYEDHHGSDHDDSDNEDEEGEHVHDAHSVHHHHHKQLTTADGQNRSYNFFHHDPDHGKIPKHWHKISGTDQTGKRTAYLVHHTGQGEQHKDEKPGHALHYLNKTPIVILPRSEVLPGHDSDSDSEEAHTIIPSAPDASLTMNHGMTNRYGLLYRDALSQRLLPGRPLETEQAQQKQSDCCCKIM